MFRLLRFTALAIILVIYNSCSQTSVDEQFKCYQEVLKELKQTPDYAELTRSYRDTIDSWLAKDIKAIRHLKHVTWEISDMVMFNKDKTKALVFFTEIDPDTSATFDNVMINAGEKINGSWHFYIQSYPCVGFNRYDRSPKRAFQTNEMLDYVVKDLITDGYYYPGKCEINYSYIDSDIWFGDWMREKHKEFLESKW